MALLGHLPGPRHRIAAFLAAISFALCLVGSSSAAADGRPSFGLPSRPLAPSRRPAAIHPDGSSDGTHRGPSASAALARLAPGTRVRVQRTSGVTEHDWVIHENRGHTVVVQKGQLRKEVRARDLLALNAAGFDGPAAAAHGPQVGWPRSRSPSPPDVRVHDPSHPVRGPPVARAPRPKVGPRDPFVTLEEGYLGSSTFAQWVSPGPIPTEGWKLHVSASHGDTHAVAERVLPVLREMGVAHKIVRTPERYENAMVGTQAGKFITVYPRSPAEAERVAKVLDGKLGGLRGVPIAGELSLGERGMVFARYGGFTKSTVRGPDGEEVHDVRGQVAPAWVPSPFRSVKVRAPSSSPAPPAF